MNPLANPAYLLPPLIAAILCFLLLVMVLRRNRHSLVHRVFSFFIFTVGLWGLLVFAMRSSADVQHALLWDRPAAAIVLISSVVYYHFALTYTNTKGTRALGLLTCLFIVLATVLAPTNLLVDHMELKSYGYAYIAGPLLYPMAFFAYILMALGIYHLIRAYRASAIYEERNRLLYIAIATLFPVAGTMVDFFPSLYPAAILGNVAFCLITAFAILRYHLLDIYIVIRKGTAYLLMSALVAIPYVGLMLLSTHAFGTEGGAVWAYFVLLLALALLLQPLWSQMQRLVDKLFYGERYDYFRALERFSQETQKVTNLDQLSSSLTRLVSQAMQTPSTYLLSPSHSTGDFTPVSSEGSCTSTQFELKSSSPLIQWLWQSDGLVHHRDLDIFPQLQSISARERKSLDQAEPELYVPLKLRDGELVGVLILGRKSSLLTYSDEEERLIMAIAAQMSMGLENALLYAKEVAQSRELMRQADEKTEFLTVVSHELRTPLAALLASAELLAEEDLTSPSSPQHRISKLITSSAKSMDEKLSRLLNIAKMQHGSWSLELQSLNLLSLIDEAQARTFSLFQRRGQTLSLDLPDSVPAIEGDQERLLEVLLNILTNANKYSPVGSSITLRVRMMNTDLLVEVEDQAPPITPEESHLIFTPYYRSRDPNRRGIPGLGLGLFISKQIVERHGGKIWVKSGDTGNTFSLSLRLVSSLEPEISSQQQVGVRLRIPPGR